MAARTPFVTPEISEVGAQKKGRSHSSEGERRAEQASCTWKTDVHLAGLSAVGWRWCGRERGYMPLGTVSSGQRWSHIWTFAQHFLSTCSVLGVVLGRKGTVVVPMQVVI